MAVIAAIITWILVVNVQDPDRSKYFTTNVDVVNANVLTKNGKYYELKNDKASVTFRVSAKRSIIERLSNSDFTATADMNYLNDGKVPINITAERYSSQITISSMSYYLSVSVGDLQKKRFSIKPATTGTPANGVAVNSVSVSPNVLSVEGPDKIVSKIKVVKATADVKGITKDMIESVVPILLDKDGKEIDTSELTFSNTTVNVNVKTGNIKSVPINVSTSGELPSGASLASVTSNPETVEITGIPEKLNQVSSIDLPGSLIDLSTKTENFETTIDITQYLPDGVALLDDREKDIVVDVKINTSTSKEYSIPTANLTVFGLAADKTCTFVDSSVQAEITGLSEALNQLDASKITGKVDVSGLQNGSHQANVSLILNSGLSAGTVTVQVDIQDKNAKTTNNN
jgi:YbbR domain-containing protein